MLAWVVVPVIFASIPEQVADAYLFGYNKKGGVHGADKGTLFLCELDDLAAIVQPKLLRALPDCRVAPLGRIETVAVDVRVMCASQEVPEHSVESGALRADLFARPNGVQIHLPPLRARREEVLAHFEHALAGHSEGTLPRLDPDLAEWLLLERAGGCAICPAHQRGTRFRAAGPRALAGCEQLECSAPRPGYLGSWAWGGNDQGRFPWRLGS